LSHERETEPIFERRFRTIRWGESVTGLKADLRETIFKDCTFSGVDFKYSDLRGLRLDGLTFIGVKFDKAALNEATFKGATLKNASFHPVFALWKPYAHCCQVSLWVMVSG